MVISKQLYQRGHECRWWVMGGIKQSVSQNGQMDIADRRPVETLPDSLARFALFTLLVPAGFHVSQKERMGNLGNPPLSLFQSSLHVFTSKSRSNATFTVSRKAKCIACSSLSLFTLRAALAVFVKISQRHADRHTEAGLLSDQRHCGIR